MDILAAMQLSDSLRPKRAGEVINVHVVSYEKSPEPDFEAMRKIVAGADDKKPERTKVREIPQNERVANAIAVILG